MAQLFISYAHADLPIVLDLQRALEQRGLETWLDRHDIPPSTEWWQEITRAIEGSDAFVFVISPASASSKYCLEEAEYAARYNKRIVPVLFQDTDESLLAAAIRRHQWIDFRRTANFDPAIERLISVVLNDPEWVREHTRLLTEARRWEEENHNPSYLPGGRELDQAQRWLELSVGKEPPVSELHTQFISAARRAAIRRRQQISGIVAVVIIILIAVVVFALIQRDTALRGSIAAATAQAAAVAEADQRSTAEAVAQERQHEAELESRIARARALAAASRAELQVDPERSVLLAVEAVNVDHTFESEDALRQALFESHLRATLRSHNPEGKTWRGRGYLGVATARFSPDGLHLLTAGDDGTARVWEVQGGREVLVLHHPGTLTTAAYNRDGTRIVTTGWDKVARVWSASTGELIAELWGHSGGVYAAEFSHDGRLVVTASDDSTVRVWDAASGSLLQVLTGHKAGVISAHFSPDGSRIVSSSTDGTTRMWELATSSFITLEGGAGSAIFSPDGHWVGGGGGLWDGETGRKVYSIDKPSFTLSGGGGSVSFSNDGRWLLTASFDVTILDVQTGQIATIARGGHPLGVNWAEVSPDMQWVVTAGEDGTARVTDILTGDNVAVFRGHTARLFTAQFSPDGRYVATASDDGTARIWQVLSSEADAYPDGDGHRSLVMSGSTRLIALEGTDNSLSVLATDSRSVLLKLPARPAYVDSYGFDPREAMFFATYEDGLVTVWDIGSRVEKLHRVAATGQNTARFSPDNHWLVIHGTDNSLAILDATSWTEPPEFKARYPAADAIEFSPDGKRMVVAIHVAEGATAAGANNEAVPPTPTQRTGYGPVVINGEEDFHIWDFDKASELVRKMPYKLGGGGPAFSPDGNWLVAVSLLPTSDGSEAREIHVWDLRGTTEMAAPASSGLSDYLTFSPDSSMLAAVSGSEGLLWHLGSGSQPLVLRGHTDDIRRFSFSADSRWLLSAGGDSTARLWDTASGQQLSILPGQGLDVWAAAFSPDGQRIITTDAGDSARIWDRASGQLLALLHGTPQQLSNPWFSPDGRYIFVGTDHRIRSYVVSLDDLLALARQRVTRELTCAERVQFLGEQLNCPDT